MSDAEASRMRDKRAKEKARKRSPEFRNGQKALNWHLRTKGVDGFIAWQEKEERRKNGDPERARNNVIEAATKETLDEIGIKI